MEVFLGEKGISKEDEEAAYKLIASFCNNIYWGRWPICQDLYYEARKKTSPIKNIIIMLLGLIKENRHNSYFEIALSKNRFAGIESYLELLLTETSPL